MRRSMMMLMGVIALLLAGCGPNGTGTNSTPSSSGLVVVSTDHATYTPNDAMAVIVHNTLSTPIYAMDTLSSCSILTLQYQVSGAWQASQVAQCPLKRPARLIKIDAGATYTATITAGYPGLKALAFPVGSYRLMLLYTTSSNAFPTAANGTIVTSATIQVQ